MIRYENIQVTFGEFVAVPDLNLDIHHAGSLRLRKDHGLADPGGFRAPLSGPGARR